ncbi:site-specific integrase, partial [Candidatus Heimdallarchaeota archaeon]
MLKQGYAKSTIESRIKLLKILVKRGADLMNPESVKETIAKQDWSEGRKENAVDAYSCFLQMIGGSWNPPRYRRIPKLPFIPQEEELDALIAGCGPKTATFLQLLKETGMRAGEAWQLKWTDIDFASKTIRVTPEKRSNPRVFKVSDKLLAMINKLPRKSERVFGDYPLRGFARGFQRQRKRIAIKLQNPRLMRISFHTFRHWKATTLYYQTKDILFVMKYLGHKSIKNTLIYTQLVKFHEKDEFICKIARNAEEAKELIEAGFQFVCTSPE